MAGHDIDFYFVGLRFIFKIIVNIFKAGFKTVSYINEWCTKNAQQTLFYNLTAYLDE